jgi:hypothetical protein
MIDSYQESQLYRVIEKLTSTRDDLSNCISDKAKKAITMCAESINDIIEENNRG